MDVVDRESIAMAKSVVTKPSKVVKKTSSSIRDKIKKIVEPLRDDAIAVVQEKRKKKLSKEPLLPHIVIKAGAGCGKTTTLISGLRRAFALKNAITPSAQQAEIWDAICGPAGLTKPSEVKFAAFNKSIATEIDSKLPKPTAEGRTISSLGNELLRSDPRCKHAKLSEWKTTNILEKLTGATFREFYKKKIPGFQVKQVVALCKQNLIMPDDPEFAREADRLIDHYSVNADPYRQMTIELSQQVLELAMTCEASTRKPGSEFMREIDYDDQIWLPIVLDIPVQNKLDWLFVDESQDLDRSQQELAMRLADRLILCGDINQAIYGFRGADSEAMERMEELLSQTKRGCVSLPLTETRRCGHAIVKEANKIVPELTAHKSNPPGEVRSINESLLMSEVKKFKDDGVMILCRVNAPLVSTCLRLFKDDVKARIQGRNFGQDLTALIRRVGYQCEDIEEFIEKLDTWHSKEMDKLLRKKYVSDVAIIALDDKFDCLTSFAEDAETISDMVATVDRVFQDDGTGVLLSSIHRAKGLEMNRVYIVCPEKLPHPMAKLPWQVKQEMNLKCVAITRAINVLTYVVSAPSVPY